MDKYSIKQLIQLCKDKNIKGYSKKNKDDLIKIIEENIKVKDKENIKVKDKENIKVKDEENKVKDEENIKVKDEEIIDYYTKETLKEQYKIHKIYVSSRKKINVRLPCFPEDISENIIKFINHRNGDKTSNWNCDKGDLISLKYGKQECKCFTSNGPISFSPSSKWDELFFLDATDWFDKDKFILYRTRLKRNSNEWMSIKVNKKETFGEHSLQGRRPRICWKDLYPQIKQDCEKIYEGTFDNIFNI